MILLLHIWYPSSALQNLLQQYLMKLIRHLHEAPVKNSPLGGGSIVTY